VVSYGGSAVFAAPAFSGSSHSFSVACADQ
jgi:hypothetical protein